MVAAAAGTGFQAVRKLHVMLIAVLSDDGYISVGSGVPWDLPADRAHFRARTAGRWLLLGHRTYSEMIGWFRDHHPLVLSEDASFVPPIGERVETMEEAMEKTLAAGVDELVVVGGRKAFDAAMPYATHLDLTRVHTTLGSGVPFPPMDESEWTMILQMDHPADDRHAFAFTFTEWKRGSGNGSQV
ncbi:MAG: dfrA [Verrucomicrobiaceae bacterium]|nr:dfrA [Verrucomicrobiaceae bacterium]